ncbi:hypothetical protein CKM354_000393100 [Cercospora kikuchii]|uniref:Yeast cell wall synthesis Kre9/Knh1-like N-terminal domain-containing protein n=1 Tax=Cercospora kikuchii TaxID=84275 RepID=A0A9P3CD39_9PEZI|nr:uncharacterized protein CKM354_000393100 [Cercospora kikuchii]GIZ40598.1 hypothetical protein CKM354_000393100 [Cercospora kikuchii]
MQISRSLLLALASAFAAYAQVQSTGPNAFTNTAYNAVAGQTLTLTWTPSTEGTVSLILRTGANNDLDTVETIASNIPNSGSYDWSIPESAVRGSNYAIEIQSDSDTSVTNYTPQFVLESDNVGPIPTEGSSTSAPISSSVSTAASSSASETASETTTGTETSETSSATTGSTNSRTTGTAAPTSSNGDLQATQSTTSDSGAGARATAMVGMLGAVALGALAL